MTKDSSAAITALLMQSRTGTYEPRERLLRLVYPELPRRAQFVMNDGLAYLVVEYIARQPIDVHCGEGKLSTRRRVELFLQVCDVVSLAHRNLIVHCDLKSSNILLSGAALQS